MQGEARAATIDGRNLDLTNSTSLEVSLPPQLQTEFRPRASRTAYHRGLPGDALTAIQEYVHQHQTRKPHLGELRAYLDVRLIRCDDNEAERNQAGSYS